MAICRRWENEEYALRENGAGTEPEELVVANKRAMMAGMVSILVVLLGLIGYWRYDLWKNGPELFVDIPEEEQPDTFFESNFAKRHRWVRLSPDAVKNLATLGGKVRLNLFDDLQVTTEVQVRRFINGGKETSVGLLDNDPDTLMLICQKTTNPDRMMGVVVDTLGTQYLISHEIDGKHVIVEVDQAKIPGCGGVIELEQADQPVTTADQNNPSDSRPQGSSAEAQALNRILNSSNARTLSRPSPNNVTRSRVRSLASLTDQFRSLDLSDSNRKKPSINKPLEQSSVTQNPVKTSSHNLLKAMPFSQPVLAQLNPSNQSFGLWGRGGSAQQTIGPSSPGILEHLRGGDVEYIDILFVYTDDLRAAQAGNNPQEQLENLKLSITRTIELTNVIFAKCHIPLETRAADVTLARQRAMSGGDADLIAAGGPSSPAWEQVQAPVRPVFNPAANPPVFTKDYTNGAKLGIYRPKWENFNPSKLTPAGELGEALAWIGNTSNNLLYGDQYWGQGNFASTPPTQRPFINLPSGTTWTLVPEVDLSNTTADNAASFLFDSTRTPELNTGPVEHPDSSHALDGASAVGTPSGFPGGISHAPVIQYNDRESVNSGPVLIDTDADTIEWLGSPEHGLATGSVVFFESWGTAPDTMGNKMPKWRVHQKPHKLKKVDIAADGAPGGVIRAEGQPEVVKEVTGNGQKPAIGNEEVRTDVVKGTVKYPIVAGLNGVITPAQKYPTLSISEKKAHPQFEMGRASYWRLNFPGNSAEPEKSARLFLSAVSAQLGMKADGSDLKTTQVKNGLGTGHTRFQQVLHGIPVYGAHILVNQGTDGAINDLHTKYYASLDVDPSARPVLTLTAAKAAAYRKGGVKRPRMPGSGKLVWYPDEFGKAKLAWEVTVCALEPLGDFHTVVDANTGRVLLQENRICFATGSGLVYKPNPYQQKGGDENGTLVDDRFGIADNNSTELDSLLSNVTLPRLSDGIGGIIGTYADLVRLNSGDLPDNDANEPTRIYNYSRNNLTFEQPTIYYTIDRIATYFIGLGFSSANTPPNGIRDTNATWACSQWNTADQSFYSGANDAVHFGTGGVDDGEDADIVAHEYGHAVQNGQNANWGGGEMGAMGEGFSDYLAVTIFFNDGDSLYQTHHAAAVGEWDAVSYDTSFDNSLDVSKGRIKTILGGGTASIDGNSSARSTNVQILDVKDFVIDSSNDQQLYFTDNNGSSAGGGVIRRMDYNSSWGDTVDVNSTFALLAGGGGGDPDANASAANVALQQKLGSLGAIDLDTADRVAFVDRNSTGGYRIRRIEANGSLTTIAGGGAGDPNSIVNTTVGTVPPMATSLNFTDISDIKFDPTNRLYFSSANAQRVWRLETNGSIILFAGGGTQETEGQSAVNTRFGPIHNLAVHTEFFNQFVYLDSNTTANEVRIRRILVDDNASFRTVNTVVGAGVIGLNPDTAPAPVIANQVRLMDVDGIEFDGAGRMYFGDGSAQRVRRMDTANILDSVSGGGATDTGDGGPTADAVLGPMTTIAIDGKTQVYSLGATPAGGLRIRKSYGGPPIDPPNLRRVDGNKIYPDDLAGQVHADGEIWSRALWDIRAAFVAGDANGSQMADRTILQSHFALPASSSMRTAALAINNAAISLGYNAYTDAIQTAFNNRGITRDSDYTGTGDGVRLTLNTDYYISRVSGTQFKLHTSWMDAVKNTGVVDFNGTGFNVQMVRSSVADEEWGQGFNPLTSAVVGTNHGEVASLRMDLNVGGGGRYPNLHGTYGDFAMGGVTSRADLVCILTENVGGSAAGLAQKLTMRGANPPEDLMAGTTRPDDVDFNSSEVINNRDSIRNLSLQGQYLVGGYTFQHELGHVLGCAHGLGDVNAGSPQGTPGLHPHDGGITFSPYAYTNSNGVADEFLAVGNHFTTWGAGGFGSRYCTIMAYTTTRNSTRVPLFSSPVAFWKGEPTGLLRGMVIPPPRASYDRPLYMDNARTIVAVGYQAAFFRDSNGSGRIDSRTSTRPTPPRGIPGEIPVNYSRAQRSNSGGGGNGNIAASGAPAQVGPGGAANPGGGLGGGSTSPVNPGNPSNTGGGTGLGGGSTSPVNPVNPPNNTGGGTGLGGGLTGGGGMTNNLPVNPAVPNDHRYAAMRWNGGGWVNNTFTTVINGHNNGATRENAERGHPAFHGRSVWWYIEWPAGAPVITLEEVEVSTKGSTFDTTLGLLYVPKGQAAAQVSLNNSSFFRFNDNTPDGTGPFSQVTVPDPAIANDPKLKLNPGDRIYFMVDGVGGATGKVRIGVKMKR